MESIRASIEIGASIDEALRRWSDHAIPLRSRQVDFESVARFESRVTVEAYQPSRGAGAGQRELERHLAAFKRLIEERDAASTLGCDEHC